MLRFKLFIVLSFPLFYFPAGQNRNGTAYVGILLSVKGRPSFFVFLLVVD
jgi:hypothetical protein